MPTWGWILIGVAAAVVLLAVALAGLRSRRSRGLKERFGSEYDRVAADAPTRREAEAELRERERRHEELDLRPLDRNAEERFRVRWEDVQARFVDDPAGAVRDADRLIQEVMRARGYPVDDFESRAAELSVEHGDVVENYRNAHGIATAHEQGEAGTEELRHAIQQYRSLFESLVEHGRQEVRS